MIFSYLGPMNSRVFKLIFCCLPFLLLALPVPAGLNPQAWHLFPFYCSAILGIMTSPMPSGAVVLCVLAAWSVFFNGTDIALSGYASKTTWLVFGAFLIGQAFIETGLGRRLAYHLIGRFGKTALGLGYAAALTDLAVCPATPSNTARTGGIVWPIFRSLAQTLGSTPEANQRRIGSYLAMVLYPISLCSGIVFMTGLASNMLMLRFSGDVLHLQVNWFEWFTYFSVPGLITLFLAPLVVYKLYPPTLCDIDHKRVSAEGLKDLGPMKRSEKFLLSFFVLAIIGWGTSAVTHIHPTAVAVAFVALSLLFNVMSWASVASQKSAWSTLIWYGGILSLAGGLNSTGFFVWLGQVFEQNFDFSVYSTTTVMGALLFISVVTRYLFASVAAYVASIVPVLFSLGLAAGVDPMLMFLLLTASSSFGSLITHYANACGPVLFGAGFVPQRVWWAVGTAFMAVVLLVYGLIGVPYWHLLGAL